ncbi:MAG TPA: hypothetical protein EYG51_22025 [Pseudomonadales bacterium]|nr:hypothetical protein [Pseudomonadales bacterium]
MKVGDIVEAKASSWREEVNIFHGPVLVTKVYGDLKADICYLNNPHTNEPQGLGHAHQRDFMPIAEAPKEWKQLLSYWMTRAITSTDTRLCMTWEAGERSSRELERLGVL